MSSSAASVGAEAPLATIPVICGPTASGKSAIAMWLALRRELVIISADSRQIYRRFDVGTAKPSPDDQRRVAHRGVDIVEPTERYSAARWASLAQAAIEESLATGRLPIVVGGTGFYLAALFRPLWAQSEAVEGAGVGQVDARSRSADEGTERTLDSGRRIILQRALDALSTEELRRWCAALDVERAHLGRAQLLRSVEVALLSGERLSDLHITRARRPMYQASYLLVDSGEPHPRIASRAAAMLERGWDDEVRQLMRDVPDTAPAWNATGYDAVRRYVSGELDRATTLERVIVETRQYAKRQRTWFRNQLRSERVQRLQSGAPGWQEVADGWIGEVDKAMRISRERVR